MPLVGDEKRNVDLARKRELAESVREIGPPPAVVDQDRRDSCKFDFRKFLLTYNPTAFELKFSPDHERLLTMVERVVLEGGQIVIAMPRGSGKTTIMQRAEIWAALYGHRRFPMLLCADDGKFKLLLRGIKTILEANQLLLEDFPEVCHPIRSLERIANRANFQMCQGVPTLMRWGTEQVVFPTTDWTKARGNAGIVIGGGGLVGAVRGAVYTGPDGEAIRPDAVLVDDPSTRKSAKSSSQNQERHEIISGDLMGLAGPGKRMSVMCACTVIYQGDLSERLLDNELSPDWEPLRVGMIKSWPSNMKLWERYDEIRRQELLNELEDGSALKFYRDNRPAMDEGSQVYWEDRITPGHDTAIQAAMTDYFRDPRAFLAEYQNQPEGMQQSEVEELSPLELVRRVGIHKRGECPAEVSTLTCHIDVQAKLLYWAVVGWSHDFAGYVIDYGTYPEQRRSYFKLMDVRRTLRSVSKGNDDSGALRAGIEVLVKDLAGRVFHRIDGAPMKIARGLIDARWRPEDVETGLQAAGVSNWMPAYGVGIGAKDAPIASWTKRKGAIRGHHAIVMKPDRRQLVGVFMDINYWKTQVHQGLYVPKQHSQAITLFKANPSQHQLFADHLCAETAQRVESRGRIVDEWKLPSAKPDNHWWDNLVGCAAAASLAGVRKESHAQQTKRRTVKKRVRKLAI